MQKAILLVHAGAGQRTDLSTAHEEESKQVLLSALRSGRDIIQKNGSALDAVEAAVKILEDFPYFNAGRGAAISNSGTCELDASIMDGASKKAGAVAGITVAKNPIVAARAVMEKSNYVLLAGEGANNFAKDQELEIVEPSYFITDHMLDKLRKAQAEMAKGNKSGTVGAVAVDNKRNVAAATSTGGRTKKSYGRVGDSPIIGAGIYADNNTCAVSCTGYGEMFIRYVVAYDIAALIEYKGLSLKEAANIVINEKLAKAGGDGGVIVLDKEGNYAMPYNTPRMTRGCIAADGQAEVYLY